MCCSVGLSSEFGMGVVPRAIEGVKRRLTVELAAFSEFVQIANRFIVR